MFTKNQIENWFELFKLSDNKNFKLEYDNNRKFLKRDLVEAKVQVDRWGNPTTHWVFHSSKENHIKFLFPEEEKSADHISMLKAIEVIQKYAIALDLGIDMKGRKVEDLSEDELILIEKNTPEEKKDFRIWNARVHFTDFIEPDRAIGICLNDDNITLQANHIYNVTNSIVVFDVK